MDYKKQRNPLCSFYLEPEIKTAEAICPGKKDKLEDKIQEDLQVFDPRNTMLKMVGMKTNDVYKADLFLMQLFSDSNHTIESQDLDWSKVLEKSKPGILY